MEDKRDDSQLSKRINDNRQIMRELYDASESVRTAIIPSLEKETVMALVEVALNIFLKNVPVNKRQYNALLRHREDLKELVRSQTGIRKKVDILQGKGFVKDILTPFRSHL